MYRELIVYDSTLANSWLRVWTPTCGNKNA